MLNAKAEIEQRLERLRKKIEEGAIALMGNRYRLERNGDDPEDGPLNDVVSEMTLAILAMPAGQDDSFYLHEGMLRAKKLLAVAGSPARTGILPPEQLDRGPEEQERPDLYVQDAEAADVDEVPLFLQHMGRRKKEYERLGELGWNAGKEPPLNHGVENEPDRRPLSIEGAIVGAFHVEDWLPKDKSRWHYELAPDGMRKYFVGFPKSGDVTPVFFSEEVLLRTQAAERTKKTRFHWITLWAVRTTEDDRRRIAAILAVVPDDRRKKDETRPGYDRTDAHDFATFLESLNKLNASDQGLARMLMDGCSWDEIATGLRMNRRQAQRRAMKLAEAFERLGVRVRRTIPRTNRAPALVPA